MAQNPSYTYTPTFMEKILGRNYKWWYVILYNFKANLAYRTTAFFIIFRDLTPLIISLTIYGSLTDSNQYLNYFLFGNLFFKWLTLFADINWEISYAIKDGTLSKYLMSPIGWLKYEFFAVIGGNFYPVLINSFIFFTIIFFSRISLETSFTLLWLLPFFILAVIIYFCMDLLVGLVAFWTPETNTLIEMKTILTPFLAGALVFLDTNFITQKFVYLPWSFMVHHPMQIYLGNYNLYQTLWVFLGGITWCLVLYFLAKFVFKMGLKRNESVGL
jgi:ABC-2 type transport system permease protein